MKGKKISGKFHGMIGGRHLLILCMVFSIFLVAINTESAFAQRKNKMPDISQKSRPEWGNNWCAPTAVGNSFLWLALEYPWLSPLVKVNGTGSKMSGEDLINVLGLVDMKTDPNRGTTDANTKAGKESYIERHGLKNKISVEQIVWPTRQWLKEQYDKGQDIELGIGYYLWNDATNKWERKNGGHVQTYGEYNIPGEEVGGHVISLTDILLMDTTLDFKLTFTDPGRNDLTGEYGAIASETYLWTDPLGTDILSTASTYNAYYDPNIMGLGFGGYTLDGYQGAGDFLYGATTRTTMSVIEIAWAESPIPEPTTILLLGLGLMGVSAIRKRLQK